MRKKNEPYYIRRLKNEGRPLPIPPPKKNEKTEKENEGGPFL